MLSGKDGAFWIYTAPTLILKYENIKLKKKRMSSGRGPTSKL
jgi:hypothetical protein